jgi:hypothetical protein
VPGAGDCPGHPVKSLRDQYKSFGSTLARFRDARPLSSWISKLGQPCALVADAVATEFEANSKIRNYD